MDCELQITNYKLNVRMRCIFHQVFVTVTDKMLDCIQNITHQCVCAVAYFDDLIIQYRSHMFVCPGKFKTDSEY